MDIGYFDVATNGEDIPLGSIHVETRVRVAAAGAVESFVVKEGALEGKVRLWCEALGLFGRLTPEARRDAALRFGP